MLASLQSAVNATELDIGAVAASVRSVLSASLADPVALVNMVQAVVATFGDSSYQIPAAASSLIFDGLLAAQVETNFSLTEVVQQTTVLRQLVETSDPATPEIVPKATAALQNALASFTGIGAGIHPEVLATCAHVCSFLLLKGPSNASAAAMSLSEDLATQTALFVLLNAKSEETHTFVTEALSITAGAIKVLGEAGSVPGGIPLAKPVPVAALKALGTSNGTAFIGVSSVRVLGGNPLGPWKAKNTNNCLGGSCPADAGEREPLSSPITITLSSHEGKILKLLNSPEPVQVVLPLAKTHNMSQEEIYQELERHLLTGQLPHCRYWNTTSLSWENDGCLSVSIRGTADGADLICSCTHLTTFSVFDIVQELVESSVKYLLVELIDCANVQAMFNSEGAATLVAWAWGRRPSAGVPYTILIHNWLLLLFMIGVDFRLVAQWRRLEEEEDRSQLGDLIPPSGSLLKSFYGLLEFFVDNYKWRMNEAARIVFTFAGHRLGVCRATFHLLSWAEKVLLETPNPNLTYEEKRARLKQLGRAARVEMTDDLSFLQRHEEALEIFRRPCSRRLPMKVAACVAALYPLRKLTVSSMYEHYTSRVFLIINPIVGSTAMSALLFHDLGVALAANSPEACVPVVDPGLAWRLFWAGLASNAIASGPVLVLSQFKQHRALPGRRPMRLKAFGFYVSAISVWLFYVAYIAAFVANTQELSTQQWIKYGVLQVLLTTLLSPIVTGILKFFMCAAVLSDPDIVRRISLDPDGELRGLLPQSVQIKIDGHADTPKALDKDSSTSQQDSPSSTEQEPQLPGMPLDQPAATEPSPLRSADVPSASGAASAVSTGLSQTGAKGGGIASTLRTSDLDSTSVVPAAGASGGGAVGQQEMSKALEQLEALISSPAASPARGRGDFAAQAASAEQSSEGPEPARSILVERLLQDLELTVRESGAPTLCSRATAEEAVSWDADQPLVAKAQDQEEPSSAAPAPKRKVPVRCKSKAKAKPKGGRSSSVLAPNQSAGESLEQPLSGSTSGVDRHLIDLLSHLGAAPGGGASASTFPPAEEFRGEALDNLLNDVM